MEIDAYKANRAKIKAYNEKYGRFKGAILLILRGVRLLEIPKLYKFK